MQNGFAKIIINHIYIYLALSCTIRITNFFSHFYSIAVVYQTKCVIVILLSRQKQEMKMNSFYFSNFESAQRDQKLLTVKTVSNHDFTHKISRFYKSAPSCQSDLSDIFINF